MSPVLPEGGFPDQSYRDRAGAGKRPGSLLAVRVSLWHETQACVRHCGRDTDYLLHGRCSGDLIEVGGVLLRLGVFAGGEYHWHKHQDQDEFFYVLGGRLRIDLEGGDPVQLAPGMAFSVPRGMLHRPVVLEPTQVLMVLGADAIGLAAVPQGRAPGTVPGPLTIAGLLRYWLGIAETDRLAGIVGRPLGLARQIS